MPSTAEPSLGGTTAEPTPADVAGVQASLLERYMSVLAGKGIEWGLLGPREADRIWGRHVLNSLAIEGLVPRGAAVVDVGSGAGLPGIPLAIVRPDLTVTLLEPLLRRFTFLGETVEELGLADRVEVVRGRAEDHLRHYDVVTCRAVAPLDKLLRWTSPLFLPDGQLLALKGSSAVTELKGAQPMLAKLKAGGEVLTIRAHPAAESTFVIKVSGRRGRA